LRAVTLRLRPKNHVKWGDDVVDNEGMGKRKSNKCCIFHKRKKFGESSSDSDCSSGSDSGANSGSGSPRRRSSDSSVSRNRRAKCICEPQQGQAAAINKPASLNRGTDGPGALRGWMYILSHPYDIFSLSCSGLSFSSINIFASTITLLQYILCRALHKARAARAGSSHKGRKHTFCKPCHR
jgi:hypothetical protein